MTRTVAIALAAAVAACADHPYSFGRLWKLVVDIATEVAKRRESSGWNPTGESRKFNVHKQMLNPRPPAGPTSRYPSPSSARTELSRTFAPRVMSSGAVYSRGEWLIPSRLGTKIIPTGPSSAMLWASCPAPEGIRTLE